MTGFRSRVWARWAPQAERRWRRAEGQTPTEYLMILGLLTALIIVVTDIVVPMISWVVLRIVIARALMISSV